MLKTKSHCGSSQWSCLWDISSLRRENIISRVTAEGLEQVATTVTDTVGTASTTALSNSDESRDRMDRIRWLCIDARDAKLEYEKTSARIRNRPTQFCVQRSPSQNRPS